MGLVDVAGRRPPNRRHHVPPTSGRCCSDSGRCPYVPFIYVGSGTNSISAGCGTDAEWAFLLKQTALDAITIRAARANSVVRPQSAFDADGERIAEPQVPPLHSSRQNGTVPGRCFPEEAQPVGLTGTQRSCGAQCNTKIQPLHPIAPNNQFGMPPLPDNLRKDCRTPENQRRNVGESMDTSNVQHPLFCAG